LCCGSLVGIPWRSILVYSALRVCFTSLCVFFVSFGGSSDCAYFLQYRVSARASLALVLCVVDSCVPLLLFPNDPSILTRLELHPVCL